MISVSSATEKSSITIREIELISEMREVESLQKEVWGCDDRDIVPFTILVATREIGAILIGAFDESSLIGFVYSFVGREDERLVHHSHMLAVKPDYRNVNLGCKLKLAQRDRQPRPSWPKQRASEKAVIRDRRPERCLDRDPSGHKCVAT